MTRAAIAIAVMLLAGCSGGSTQEVLVSSAASLTDVFAAMEAAFEADHPDIDVVLNLGGSSALREQILSGAPADVFASANLANMEAVRRAGYVVGESAVFAENELAIAVPAGNPGGVFDLGGFSEPDLLIGLCAATVPCGDFARQALSRAGIEPAIDTNEPDVRALLTKLAAAELDAGIVYVTDVVGRETVESVRITSDHNVVAEYPIAVLSSGLNTTGAEGFVDFVTSSRGQSILVDYGFILP